MKRIFTLLSVLLFAFAAWAGSNSTLKITLQNGEIAYVSLEKAPTLSHHFDADLNDWVVVVSDEGTPEGAEKPLEYAISAVKKYEFVDKIEDGIDEIHASSSNKPSFVINGKSIHINGCDRAVSAYSINGTMTTTAQPDANGCVSLDLSQQPAGIYVIKINKSQTIKVSIR